MKNLLYALGTIMTVVMEVSMGLLTVVMGIVIIVLRAVNRRPK